MEKIILDSVPVIIMILALGVFIGLGGRHYLKKLLNTNGAICPITERGETPLTKEEHKAICDASQMATQVEIGHLNRDVKEIKTDMREIKGDIKTLISSKER
jgi:hypothetical protein